MRAATLLTIFFIPATALAQDAALRANDRETSESEEFSLGA